MSHSIPQSLRKISAIIGTKKTHELMAKLKNKENIYIPKKRFFANPLTDVLNIDEMNKVMAQLGGTRISIPQGSFYPSKKESILRTSGTADQIAQKLQCTPRYVRLIKKMTQ